MVNRAAFSCFCTRLRRVCSASGSQARRARVTCFYFDDIVRASRSRPCNTSVRRFAPPSTCRKTAPIRRLTFFFLGFSLGGILLEKPFIIAQICMSKTWSFRASIVGGTLRKKALKVQFWTYKFSPILLKISVFLLKYVRYLLKMCT